MTAWADTATLDTNPWATQSTNGFTNKYIFTRTLLYVTESAISSALVALATTQRWAHVKGTCHSTEITTIFFVEMQPVDQGKVSDVA